MNKVMLNGEYMSIETAEKISLLKRENKRLKEKYEFIYKYNEYIENILQKAIDYIENELLNYECIKDEYVYTLNDLKDILEILKGENENGTLD